MKTSALIICLLATEIAQAQSVPSAVQPVVDAELGFARTSKEKSTKVAFLENLAEEAVVFANGQAVRARERWTKLSENNGLLFWWPVVADVSQSGDLGYTIGPYEVSADRSNPSPIAFGYYSTIWKRYNTGWKVVVDIGISFPAPENTTPALSSPHTGVRPAPGTGKPDLLSFDKSYNEACNGRGKSIDQSLMSEHGRIHRTGHWPVTTREGIAAWQDSGTFVYEQLGGEVATSGELGYCYGNATVTTGAEKRSLNYLRVWRLEGGSWKIVLDVVGG